MKQSVAVRLPRAVVEFSLHGGTLSIGFIRCFQGQCLVNPEAIAIVLETLQLLLKVPRVRGEDLIRVVPADRSNELFDEEI